MSSALTLLVGSHKKHLACKKVLQATFSPVKTKKMAI